MARSGPRGSYAPGVARREEIVATALEVFAERGFDGVSLREIAARIGITHTGLRHHFGSKVDLLMAVLRYRDEHVVMPEEVARLEGMAWLRAALRVVAANEASPRMVQLYATMSAAAVAPDHPAHHHFVGRYRFLRGLVAEKVAQAQRDGDIREDADPGKIAQVLLSTMDGLQVQWLLEPEAIDLATVYEEFFARYLDSFAPGDRTAADRTVSRTPRP